jgi:hypothetical protein
MLTFVTTLVVVLIALRVWLPQHIINMILEDTRELTPEEYWEATKVLGESRHLKDLYAKMMEDGKLTHGEWKQIKTLDCRQKLERAINNH